MIWEDVKWLRWVRVTVGGPIDAKRNYIEPFFRKFTAISRNIWTSSRNSNWRHKNKNTDFSSCFYFFISIEHMIADAPLIKYKHYSFRQKKMFDRLLASIWAAQRWPVCEQKVVNCFFFYEEKKIILLLLWFMFRCWCSPIRIYWFDCSRTVAGCRVKQVLCTMNRPSNNIPTHRSHRHRIRNKSRGVIIAILPIIIDGYNRLHTQTHTHTLKFPANKLLS